MCPRILLVTPARASDNNGNYHTADRWAKILSAHFEVTVSTQYAGEVADVLLALHARRSAAAIRAFQARNPKSPVVLTLTGTDLYKDLPAGDADALDSLRRAKMWIMLQEHAPYFLSNLKLPILPDGQGRDVQVVFQSALPMEPAPKRASLILNVAFVGHLREEKDPRTLFNAVRMIPKHMPLAVNVVGNGLDSTLVAEASQLAADDARFAWLGGLSHDKARELIRQADVLVVSSIMEGGANVISEALMSGTPVIASAVSGNMGMLGPKWPAYFEAGNAGGLAQLLTRCVSDRPYYDTLLEAAQQRAHLFHPQSEAIALTGVIADALKP
jgi:putative glycosyltransferase (TIGR04348 family)